MIAWSQSPFLQALGWAMLNSLWQMAFLYGGFMLVQHTAPLSSKQKYYGAVGALATGLLWFSHTFFQFYAKGVPGSIVGQHPFAPTPGGWHLLLSLASLVYLLLLLVPAYRLAKNWQYIEHLKKMGLQKTAMEYRLFVKTVARRLGIKHTVHVYLSQLVQSPVTIGYIKPVILLPIAAVTSLSTQQVEAVLLHELSHIKRHDYLINLIINLLQTLFYFNPFIKKFVSVIEFEREKCCDELVLQFQCDKISYASALLLLEKNMMASEALVMAAAGKKHLLSRIEKIVGREREPRFTFRQFAGVMSSFLCVLFINSLFFVHKDLKQSKSNTVTAFENPLYQYDAPKQTFPKGHPTVAAVSVGKGPTSKVKPATDQVLLVQELELPLPIENEVLQIAFDASDDMVAAEEKEKVIQTVKTTRQVLAKSKWHEVEASIGDGMTAAEKKLAKNEYLVELNKIDWIKLESYLKQEYATLDWLEIEMKLNSALIDLKLDSLQKTYKDILTQLRKSEVHPTASCKHNVPLPDISIRKISALKDTLRSKVDSIDAVRRYKIVNF